MINIYDRKITYKDAILSNGLYTLDKLVISAETTEDIAGNYELNIELELQGDAPTGLYELIQADNIIKVNDEGSEELFRIAQVNKGLETIEIYCRHITIADSLNLWLNNVKPTELNGNAALQWLAARTVPKCNIIFSSNLANVSTADYVNKNLYEALFEADNAFVKRWGGEVKRTGYTVRIDDKIGQDKTGVIKIKEGLNLAEFNAKTNIDEVTTVIYPKGYDGITAPRVVSKLVNNYSMEFPAEIKWDDVKVEKRNEQGEITQEGWPTEEQAKEELTRRAKAEFEKKHIDQIQFTCDIDFLDLNKFEEYKDLTQLQTANLGDFVSVRVDTFDLDIKARIVSRTYDVLRDRRIESTLSTDGELKKPIDINDIIKDLTDKIEGEGVGDLSGYIDSMIQQGFKNGYVIYDKNACYAVDKLPKEQAKNVVVLNRNGLGYSSTGIAGPYKYGFTIDGKLNADMITTGALGGQYIKAGTLEANRLSVNAKKEISDQFGKSDAFINLDASVTGLSSTVGTMKNTIKGQETSISNISQKADRIELSVNNKVGKNDIISSINLSKEGVKIKANKLEVTGDFITKSDLVDGVTTISGSNIKTGTIKSQNLEGCNINGANIQGTETLYMGFGGVMSCDGETYIRKLYVPLTHPEWKPGVQGSFSVDPVAWFGGEIHVGKNTQGGGDVWVYGAKNKMGVIRRYDEAFIQIDRMAVQNEGKNYLQVVGYKSKKVFGVDLWGGGQYSIDKPKTLITENNARNLGNTFGIDAIKQINHYAIETVVNDENRVQCDYDPKELQKINNALTYGIEQEDGTIEIVPSTIELLTNITLAIQQQQKTIEAQEARIAALEEKIVTLINNK